MVIPRYGVKVTVDTRETAETIEDLLGVTPTPSFYCDLDIIEDMNMGPP